MSPEKAKYKPQIKYRISDDDLISRGVFEAKKPLSFLPTIAEAMDYLLKGLVIWIIYTGGVYILRDDEVANEPTKIKVSHEPMPTGAAQTTIRAQTTVRAQLSSPETKAEEKEHQTIVNPKRTAPATKESSRHLFGRVLNQVNDQINGAAQNLADSLRETLGISPVRRE